MENLIEKLQKEAGLTEDQAHKALSVVKDFMDKENLDIDWEKFAKGKFEDVKGSVSSLFHKVSEKAGDCSDKSGDTLKDLSDQADQKIKDISKGKEDQDKK